MFCSPLPSDLSFLACPHWLLPAFPLVGRLRCRGRRLGLLHLGGGGGDGADGAQGTRDVVDIVHLVEDARDARLVPLVVAHERLDGLLHRRHLAQRRKVVRPQQRRDDDGGDVAVPRVGDPGARELEHLEQIAVRRHGEDVGQAILTLRLVVGEPRNDDHPQVPRVLELQRDLHRRRPVLAADGVLQLLRHEDEVGLVALHLLHRLRGVVFVGDDARVGAARDDVRRVRLLCHGEGPHAVGVRLERVHHLRRRDGPHADDAVRVRGDDLMPAVEEARLRDTDLVVLERPRARHGAERPHLDAPVVARADEQAVRGGEGQRRDRAAVAGEAAELRQALGLEGPQVDGLVLAARGDDGVVRGDGDAVNRAEVRVDCRLHRDPALLGVRGVGGGLARVPELDGLVGADGDDDEGR
mmetsp:Transcript_11426/g.35506  ORF Transcript_11426/g.35506 Transcript_11426/m.35506 type:complete len:412 (-) Transcript_11426:826-2061(-)